MYNKHYSDIQSSLGQKSKTTAGVVSEEIYRKEHAPSDNEEKVSSHVMYGREWGKSLSPML